MNVDLAYQSISSICLSVVDCPHATPKWTDQGVVVLRNQNIKGGRLDLSKPSFTDEDHYNGRVKRAAPRAGDIVITREAPMGDVCQIPKGLRCCLGQRQVLLRPNPDKIDSRFLLFALQSPHVQNQIGWNEGTGSTVSNLRIPVLEALTIPTPSLVQQREIAATLGVLDDRIALLRETNSTLEAIAQALFKSWFVDFDPVRAKLDGRVPEGMDEATAALFPDSFDESEIGLVPSGWAIARLEAVAIVMMGLSPAGDSYNDEGDGVPLINGPVEFGEYFPKKTKWTRAATRFSMADDLIFCVRGSTTGRRVISDGKYCIGRGVCAIRPLHSWNNFIYETINSGLNRLLEKTTGSVFPSLSALDIKGFKVLRPSDVVVNFFEHSLGPLLQQVQANHRKSMTLSALRNTLLPSLISGQLRLAEAEALLDEVVA